MKAYINPIGSYVIDGWEKPIYLSHTTNAMYHTIGISMHYHRFRNNPDIVWLNEHSRGVQTEPESGLTGGIYTYYFVLTNEDYLVFMLKFADGITWHCTH